MLNRFIAGIDYSLCCPAICVFEIEEKRRFCFKNCAFFYLTETKSLSGQILDNVRGETFEDWNHECERYDTIADWACDKVRACEHVALEDYAYSAKGRVFHIAENTGLLKYKLWKADVPIDVVSPTHVKRIATGKGNSDKEEMFEAFLNECKVDLKMLLTPGRTKLASPVTDIVDAYYICKFLHAKTTGAPMVAEPKEEPPGYTPSDDED